MSVLTNNLNSILSIKADIKSAIEAKGVDMTGISFPGYASKIGEISGGSGVNPSGTLEVSENGVYNVYSYASVSVDVPISGWDQKSFTEGVAEIINLDNSASFVASNAFNGNKTIQTVNLPYATSVGNSAFYECSSLTNVNIPMCSYIGSTAFAYCDSLSQVNLPVCTTIRNNAFQYCYLLSQVSIPMCNYINMGTFRDCYQLSQLTLPMCSGINRLAFVDCSSLSIITIGYSSICSLFGYTVFDGTKITSSTGSIYVPASLVDAYKSATNWSYFSTQIFPIPE